MKTLSITNQLFILVLLYIIAYAYSLQFAVALNDCNSKVCEKFKSAHESCLLDVPMNMGNIRDKSYYIGRMTPEKLKRLSHCGLSFWSATHFSLYCAIGIFCPDLFWLSFAIGSFFEVYEHFVLDCGALDDIFQNTMGFFAGRLIRLAM
ncbi:MAG: hypothetical protein M0R33_18950 [Methylomonas sp.]|jgi:hypothetical protein|uniref:hypothetical protein n=1 Tax=Methylomonas sp. TaxID=418 RepID=UPI0025ED8290|nr:hypothetical protein [Methylomonas sp.]MCK9608524.1 hypothetical protein [Methylomonas sp.]